MKNVTEQELIEKSKGERVTLADVEWAIRGQYYFTAEQAVHAAYESPCGAVPSVPSLGLLTICTLTLWNGWTVLGKSACADPANFNEEIGKRLARADAVNQIWPLMGYDLKSRMQRDQHMVAKALAPAEGSEGFTTYIGTKVVNASPATRFQYAELRRWELPADENGEDEGYIVEYADATGDPSNVAGFQGYISWSPKEVFERAYRPVKAAGAACQPASAQPKAGSTPAPKGCVAAQVDVLQEEYGPVLHAQQERRKELAK